MSNDNPILFNDESPDASFQMDEPAFEVFFKQNFVVGCAFCRCKFGFDDDLAKEMVHSAYIKLWEGRQRLTTNVTLRSYLFRIIINNSLDAIKQQKTRQQYSKFFVENSTEAFEETGINSTDYKQLAADIKAAIAELPVQMRTIFEMSRYEGLKYNAIANRLNISVKTVETQMSRALVKLREKLRHHILLFIAVVVLTKFF